jgi:hypothetical protein
MAAEQWYTLVRFQQTPQQLTGVSQARTADEALMQAQAWEEHFPVDTTVVFGPDNRPMDRTQLEYLAAGLRPPRQRPAG